MHCSFLNGLSENCVLQIIILIIFISVRFYFLIVHFSISSGNFSNQNEIFPKKQTVLDRIIILIVESKPY